MNGGYRHVQDRLTPCESAATGHRAVAFQAFGAWVAQNIKTPREDVWTVTALARRVVDRPGHEACPEKLKTTPLRACARGCSVSYPGGRYWSSPGPVYWFLVQDALMHQVRVSCRAWKHSQAFDQLLPLHFQVKSHASRSGGPNIKVMEMVSPSM